MVADCGVSTVQPHSVLGAGGPLTCLYGTEMLLAELLEFSGMFDGLNN